MIQRRFSVFEGIGPKTEQALWNAGVKNWQSYLASGGLKVTAPKKHEALCRQIQMWARALEQKDSGFFTKHLQQSEHWLLYEVFGNSVRYLDIETSGLSGGWDQVTVVGLYDGKRFDAFVNGQGLSSLALQQALEGCRLLVTFFGSGFDVPVLKKAYPEVHWAMPHFDLCFAGRRLGLRGGLEGNRENAWDRARAVHRADGWVRGGSVVV